MTPESAPTGSGAGFAALGGTGDARIWIGRASGSDGAGTVARMRFEVLINGGAGSVDQANDEAEIAAIEEAFEAAGAVAHVQLTDPDDLGKVVKATWASDDRPDAVIIGGGDGTVGGAAEAALDSDIVLGVLPLGTFNHFAKDLGMPMDLKGAAAALVNGEVRVVDVGEVNGRVFVNNSTLGVYPTMVAIRDDIQDRHGWGKVRSVPVAAWRALKSFPLHRYDLTADGYGRHQVRTPLIFVGNGVYDNATGGAYHRADLADGYLGVSVAKVISRWGLVRMILRTVLAGSAQASELDVSELTDLRVDSHGSRVRVALDGEAGWMEPPLRFRSRSDAIKILAPAPPPPEGKDAVDHPVTPSDVVGDEVIDEAIDRQPN